MPVGRFPYRSHLRALGLAALLCAVSPSEALAVSGLYLQLGLGYGSFSGNELIVHEDTSQPNDIPNLSPNQCCPDPGLASQFRLGFSVLGFAGPEFLIMGDGWNLFSNAGGGGFVGGGVRFFPLQFISLGGLDVSEFPLDIGMGVGFGWAVVGKDFAYTGTFWDLDLNVEYKLASAFSAGIKLDVVLPSYSDFAFTDYNGSIGRCLDETGSQVIDDRGSVMPKEGSSCSGRGPGTTFISPQIVFTFHFDPLEV